MHEAEWLLPFKKVFVSLLELKYLAITLVRSEAGLAEEMKIFKFQKRMLHEIKNFAYIIYEI